MIHAFLLRFLENHKLGFSISLSNYDGKVASWLHSKGEVIEFCN